MGNPQRIAGKLLLAVVCVASVLGLFELGLGIVHRNTGGSSGPNPAAELYTFSDNRAILFEPVPNVHVRFVASESAAGRNPAWQVSTDAEGLRRNGGDPARDPELRGACLGDSIVFGAGLDDAATIPAQLSRIVSRRLGRSFDCLNFGVSNYNTIQEVAFFQHKHGLAHDPNVVVLGIYTNDFTARPGVVGVLDGQKRLLTGEASDVPAARLSGLRLWSLSAAAALAVRDRLRESGLYPPANGKPLKPAQSAAVTGALDELRGLLEPRDIPLVIVLFPRDWQLNAPDREQATERQRLVSAYCVEHGLTCVDVLDRFHGRPIREYFRPGDDSHPHALAAREIAEMVASPVVEELGSASNPSVRSRR